MTFLGIELGSTRIKAVLIDEGAAVLATGSHTWENQLVDGLWSYSLDDAWTGVRHAYAELAADWQARRGTPLTRVDGIGISAMMHGYLAFSADGRQLAPFRTWRNTNTGTAAEALTGALQFTIPLRWSVAHLYQAVLNREAHVPEIAFLTTLAGYVHWKLTGEKVLGVGDASGMFPIDAVTHDWDAARLATAQGLLDEIEQGRAVSGTPQRSGMEIDAQSAPREGEIHTTSSDGGAQATSLLNLAQILPRVLVAGQPAGVLTPEGARLLDPSGALQPGVPFCPPEGDAGTGMVATNAVAPRTGNVSAGTSIFAMIVLERALSKLHPEIDMVTTPAGDPVAMVHCNNGASEIDAWAQVFAQFAAAAGCDVDDGRVFAALFGAALDGEPDGGGLLAYNYLAGEPITGLTEGRPLIVRTPDSRLTLPNLARTLIMSSFATLSLGMRILDDEGVGARALFAHGGVFKTKIVAQRLLAAALDVPVTVGETASEGGAWGMAVLAAYAGCGGDATLGDYLARDVFAGATTSTLAPDPADVAGFRTFLDAYERGLAIQRAAIDATSRPPAEGRIP